MRVFTPRFLKIKLLSADAILRTVPGAWQVLTQCWPLVDTRESAPSPAVCLKGLIALLARQYQGL